MIKAVIFDLDGTLLSTSFDLCEAMNNMLKRYNFPQIDEQKTKEFIGNGARKFVEASLPINTEYKDEYLDTYNEYYNKSGFKNTKLFDGIAELLIALKKRGVKLCLLTNKPQSSTDEIYEKYLKEFNFDIICGNNENRKIKPDPTETKRIIKELGFRKSEVIFVGDGETDIITAKNSRIKCISCLWGYRSMETLKKEGAKVFSLNPYLLCSTLTYMTHKPYKLVLFDMDGTLIDSSEGIFNSISYALEKIGKPIPEKSELKRFLGPPLMYSFDRVCHLNNEDSLKAVDFYRERYSVKGKSEVKVYDGMIETLISLKRRGRILGVCSYKPLEYVKAILKEQDLERYFEYVDAPTLEVNDKRNKTQILKDILKNANVKSENAIMIGDTSYDFDASIENDVDFMGVLYGFGVDLNKKSPAIFVETAEEIQYLI